MGGITVKSGEGVDAARVDRGYPRQPVSSRGRLGGLAPGGGLVLGDLLVYAPHLRQVLCQIRAEGFPVILGEWDKRVAYSLPEPIPRGIAQTRPPWTGPVPSSRPRTRATCAH